MGTIGGFLALAYYRFEEDPNHMNILVTGGLGFIGFLCHDGLLFFICIGLKSITDPPRHLLQNG